MPYSAPELRITVLQPSPAENLNSIRLASSDDGVWLTGMTASLDGMHDVSIRALKDSLGAPQTLGKLPSPFGTPFWDVAATPVPGKGFATVWTVPGSAISSLGYQAPGHAEIVLTGHYPSGVFQNPRFVRGQASPEITACALQQVGEALVLFQEGLASGQARYRPLPAVGQGAVLAGLLIRYGRGYLLLAKYPAPALGASERIDPRGESEPAGVLRAVRLDADFRAVDSAFSPLGDSAIYDFDADAGGDRIYVLATSPQGYRAAVAVVRDEVWHWTRADEAIVPGTALFSPAVSAHGKSAAMALLAANGSGQRNILHARISIQEP